MMDRCYGSLRVEARNAAKHPIMHRMDLHNRESSSLKMLVVLRFRNPVELCIIFFEKHNLIVSGRN